MKLTSFQIDMIDKAMPIIQQHGLVYLSMQTRTGKTPVSIMLAQRLAETSDINQVIFATKKSVIPSITATLELLRQDYPITIDIQIVSFDSLHKITHQPNCIIIADEAHSFGAYPKPSRRAILLAGLSRGCKVIFLSATPTPESFSQIYHQLWAARSDSPLIQPYRNFYAWARDYVKVSERFFSGRKLKDYSNANKSLIMPYLEELSVSGTKEEAGFEHCDVTEIIMRVQIPDDVVKLINALYAHRMANYGDDVIIADTPASLLSKTHQLCSGTVIGEKQSHIVSTHKTKPLRAIQVIHKKIAIFYKYIAELDMLRQYYGERLTDNADEFNSSPDKVFAGQFLSKREGIDLRTADAIVMLNIDFAYLSYEQTKNRIMNMYRIKKPVMIWLFSDYMNGKGKIESLEARIYEDVKQKKNYTLAHYKRQMRIL